MRASRYRVLHDETIGRVVGIERGR